MTNQEVFDLMACFDRSTLSAMKLSTQEFTIELSREARAAGRAEPSSLSAGEAPAPAAPPEERREGCVITAPLVGTYYAAPAPEEAPFVAPGDRVAKGQTVCLIEAMKMMSEVTAPCDCVIQEVRKTSGDLVAFGEPLFRYRPC